VGPGAGLDGCGKSRPPQGFDPRTVQPVASRYCIFSFLLSKCFRFLNKTRENEANNCNCLKLTIPVRGGHRDYSSRAPDIAAVPLAITFLSTSIRTQTPLGQNPSVRTKKPASHRLRYGRLLTRTYIQAPTGTRNQYPTVQATDGVHLARHGSRDGHCVREGTFLILLAALQ
jgi:hypothetical protein